MSFIKKHKNQKEIGFSLVEIMTTMVMIVVLSTIVFVNYKSSQKQLALQRAANRVAQDIRRTENMAGSENADCALMSGYKYGYGLSFQAGAYSYKIFADCNGDNSYNPAVDKIVEQASLESGVICRTTGDVVFILPDPIVSNAISVNLEVENSSPLQSKIIRINTIGAVDF
jgi:type II secretory pathway pseudopilin PulG